MLGFLIFHFGVIMMKFIDVMKNDFEEFHENRKIERAKNFTEMTGMHVNHNEYPAYFFGDLNAKFVLIHLNPKQKDNKSDEYEGKLKYTDFKEYFNFHQNFGNFRYNNSISERSKSRFDAKQVKFIKPFNVIDLDHEDDYVNLEKVIDKKLQLELIPFGSDSFKTDVINPKILNPYIDLLLDTIIEQERDYIIFCGSVFETLLKNYLVSIKGEVQKKDYKFKLLKGDGSTTKAHSRFSKILLEFNGRKIHAGIAPSFPRQGLTGKLMEEYGRKCYELYNH